MNRRGSAGAAGRPKGRGPSTAVVERNMFFELLETLPAYLILLDRDHRIPYMNRFFRERFGESGGRRCYEYLFHRDSPCENCKTYDALKKMAPLEWEWTGPDGRNYYIYDYPFKDVDGSDLIMEVGIDITPQKRAQEELGRHKDGLERLVAERTAELGRQGAELDAILASIAEPVVVYDRTRNPTRLNAAARELLGGDADDGRPAGRAGTEDLADRVAVALALKGETVRNVEYSVADRLGRTRTFLGSVAPIGGGGDVSGAVSTLHDITLFKEADRSMQELVAELAAVTSEALRRADELDMLLSSVSTPVIVFDGDGDPARANPAAEAFFGFDPVGITGGELMARLQVACGAGGSGPADLGASKALGGEHVRDAQYQIRDGRGETRSVLSSCSPTRSAGKVSGAVCSLHDITDLKASEETLRRARDDWERTFDSVPDLIAILDGRQRIVRANRAMAERLKAPPDRCAGRTCHECVHGTGAPVEVCPHILTMRDGREHAAEIHEERLGGDFLVTTTPLLDGAGRLTGSVHVARDITERKRAEKALELALAQSRHREAEVSALLAGSRHVLETQDFAVSARRIFDSCLEIIGATAGYIALLSDDGSRNEVLFLESGGLPCSVDPALPMPIRGLRAEAYRTGRPAYDNGFAASEHARLLPGGHVALENVLFAPLVLEGRTAGLLGLANKPGGFTDGDARLSAAFGEMAAVALRNSRNLEALKRAEAADRRAPESPEGRPQA